MKNKIIKWAGLGCLSATMVLNSSCEDFLDRPATDSFTVNDFYKNEQQVKEAANFFYGAPWFDWQRGMLAVGDALGGNYYKGSTDPYTTLAVAGASGDENLVKMSEALWAVNGHANSTIYNINTISTVPEEVKNKYLGEVMLMKAAAYFYMVRCWGAIPIIHDNAKVISDKASFELARYKKEDVYKYIIATAYRAAELLPVESEAGRVDKTSAYGLLSKIYLTAAGVTGTLDNHYLEKAIEYGEKVFDDEAKHPLEPVFQNLFRISTGDNNPEGLITFHWNCMYNPYTSINMQHCDLAPGGSFNGTGNNWGSWSGVTVDLLDLFGADPFVTYGDNGVRPVTDPRRLAVATMYQDYQPVWYRNTTNQLGSKGFYVYLWGEKMSEEWGMADFESPTGANAGAKNIHGNIQDHLDECGLQPTEQGSNTPIHYLRVADVYLCMAEASFLLNGSVTGKSLEAFNKVRERAQQSKIDSPTYDDIWNERRKELAFEGDMWFNYVKRSYYNLEDAKQRLAAVERGAFTNMSFKDYYAGKLANTDGYKNAKEARESGLNSLKITTVPTNQKNEPFTIPFPDKDLISNPLLNADPQDYDLKGNVEYYDESKY